MDDELAHFGVMGMKWGVRKGDYPGASSSVNKEARKDAEESARAKQFYGEGAGTRRKLIKATVEGKSRKITGYKEAFDHHLANQDTSKHASKAISERHRKNAVKSTTKTARGVRHILNGNSQYASLAAAMLVGGAVYAHKSGADAVILKTAKTAYKDVKNSHSMTNAEKQMRAAGFRLR